jgi:hypothetical protein
MKLSPEELRILIKKSRHKPCRICPQLTSPGWESFPGTFDRSKLREVGSLHDADNQAPTLLEFHPNGTNSWSVNAPIALGYFPYNQCGVWQCIGCLRVFLRYTEYGGYYEDERIREANAELIVESAN